MEFSPRALAQLKEFGVTVYGARAYLALLELGVTEARAVSELANIPSAKVYAALTQLQKRGLAEVAPGKPRKYAAVPIQVFLDRRLQEQEEQAADLRDRSPEIVELFPQRPTSQLEERPSTVTVEGKRNILQHLRDACRGAERSIHVMASPILQADGTTWRVFDDAARRGVEVHFTEDALTAELVAASPASGDMEAPREASTSLLATFDARSAILARLRRGPRKEGRSSAAIVTSDPGFVGPLHRLLLERDAGTIGRPSTATKGHAHVDARTFGRLLEERTAAGPAEACAIVHAVERSELERDHLWRAARSATRMRILLSPTLPKPAAPEITASLPAAAEVRLLPRASVVAFAILDGRHAFIVTPAQGARRSADLTYAFTTDAALVRAFEAQFEAHWALAHPIAKRA